MDENDVVMCDGEDCFRAHHMHCLSPPLTPEEREQEENWFCILCTFTAKLLASVQSVYTGDEWYVEDQDTIRSWEHAKDSFPSWNKNASSSCGGRKLWKPLVSRSPGRIRMCPSYCRLKREVLGGDAWRCFGRFRL